MKNYYDKERFETIMLLCSVCLLTLCARSNAPTLKIMSEMGNTAHDRDTIKRIKKTRDAYVKVGLKCAPSRHPTKSCCKT